MSSEPTPSFPLMEGLPSRRPFGGKRRLYNVVRLRFKTHFITHLYDTQMLELHKGDKVIAETSRGPVVAELTEEVRREIHPRKQLRKVLRKATDRDLETLAENEAYEREAFRYAIERVRDRDLSMKLIQVHIMHDRSRMVFYFSSEGRVDFRLLVRDLAQRLRTRIEMRQIGARDGARMVGGLGPCGRELCCSTFLEKFAPVSIRMAKDQGLTLNPRKVSGMCGRLMCCLVYEQQIYHRARRRLPRVGKPVSTAEGLGTIRTVNVLQETVRVLLDDGQDMTLPLSEVVILTSRELERRRESSQDEPPASPEQALRSVLTEVAEGEDEYLWEDDAGLAEKKKPARRRKKPEEGAAAKPEEAEDGGEGGDAEDSANKNRRKRRRRRRTTEGAPAPQAGEKKAEARKSAPRQGSPKKAEGAPKKAEGAPKAAAQSPAPAADGGDKPRRKRRRRRRKPGEGGGEGGGGEEGA